MAIPAAHTVKCINLSIVLYLKLYIVYLYNQVLNKIKIAVRISSRKGRI